MCAGGGGVWLPMVYSLNVHVSLGGPPLPRKSVLLVLTCVGVHLKEMVLKDKTVKSS